MVSMSLRMPAHLAARIRAVARDTGVSRSALMREAIERHLSGGPPSTPSAFDLMADLVGTWEGPPDLSTNPKYLEGFGE